MSNESKKHFWSPEECLAKTSGVCRGCGGPLSAIETVDNSGNPTHWPGCLECSTFCYGVAPKIFTIANKMVREGGHVPYTPDKPLSQMNEHELRYHFTSNVRGTTSLVQQVLFLAAEIEKGNTP